MIEDARDEDLESIRQVVAETVAACIDVADDVLPVLLKDILSGLDWWRENKQSSVLLKYTLDGGIVGMVMVKNYWNVSDLFVLPTFHRRGIGRALMGEALRRCEGKTDRVELKLNSSNHAVEFYRSLGFVPSGEPRDLPGGCVPLSKPFEPGE